MTKRTTRTSAGLPHSTPKPRFLQRLSPYGWAVVVSALILAFGLWQVALHAKAGHGHAGCSAVCFGTMGVVVFYVITTAFLLADAAIRVRGSNAD